MPRRQLLPGGVVSEQPQALAGESWAQGQVILAWSEVLAGAADPADGRNVVLHEFAHQIDQDGGDADGRPWQRDDAARQRWAAVVDEGLARLREHRRRRSTPTAAPTRPSSSRWPPRPSSSGRRRCATAAPQLYGELARLYRLDPAAW